MLTVTARHELDTLQRRKEQKPTSKILKQRFRGEIFALKKINFHLNFNLFPPLFQMFRKFQGVQMTATATHTYI